MKKVLITLVLMLLPGLAIAQTVQEDLIGLGMKPEQADYLAGILPGGSVLDNNTYLKGRNQANSADINIAKITTGDDTQINSSASDDLILQLEDDANRLISFDAASDTALRMFFGDATSGQNLSILGSSVDAADDQYMVLAPASSAGTGRSAFVGLGGNEAAAYEAAVQLNSGNDTNGRLQMKLNNASAIFQVLNSSNGALWSVDHAGGMSNDATNGGDLTFNAVGSQPKFPAIAVITPSTSYPTPNAGDSISNRYNQIAAGAPTAAYVELPRATPNIGKTFSLNNLSSNPVAIVPIQGDGVNATAAGTPYTCATGKFCDCIVAGNTTSICKSN